MTKKEFRQEVINNITNYPGNITAALRLSANKGGRAFSTAAAAYYNKKDGIRDNDVCFITHTVNGILINTKIVGVRKEGPRSLHLNTTPLSLKGMQDNEKIALFDIMIGNQ